jgi:MFS family permease
MLTTGTMVAVLSGLQTIVIPVIGDIAGQLDRPLDQVGWVLTANLLGAAVTTPLIGRLGDRYGKRPVILAVLAVVAVGSLLAALTSSLAVLVAARVLQSTAYGLFPLAVGVLRDELPEERLIPGLALLSALLSIGGGLGLISTGLVADGGGGYRAIFWLSLVATVVPLVACSLVLPRRPPPHGGGSIDWWGAALLGATTVLVLLPLSQGAEWGWASAPTTGCLIGAVVAGWVFSRVERRRASPLVSPRLLADRRVTITMVAAVLLGIAAFSSFLGISQFVQEPRAGGFGFGVSVLETSLLYLLPGTAASVLMAPVTGRIIRGLGGRLVLAGASAVGGLSFVALAIWHASPWQVVVLGMLSGVGNSMAFAAIPSLLVRYVDQSETGVATGLASIARSIGSSLASALAATLIAGLVVQATGRTALSAYVAIFLVGAASFLAITVVGLLGLPPDGGRTAGPVRVGDPSLPGVDPTARPPAG